jgi:hypothetical protein
MYSKINIVSLENPLKQCHLFIFVLIALIFNGCMPKNYTPTKTSLQLQAFQAKEFETSKKIAFAATLSVFQDLGYVMESGDFETGLITAKSPTQSGQVWGGSTQKFTKATGFVETIREKVARIRLNFVEITKASSAYGMQQGVDVPIEEPKLYQEVFEKIEKAIFVRSNVN